MPSAETAKSHGRGKKASKPNRARRAHEQSRRSVARKNSPFRRRGNAAKDNCSRIKSSPASDLFPPEKSGTRCRSQKAVARARCSKPFLPRTKVQGREKIARSLGLNVSRVSWVLRAHNVPRPLGRGGRTSTKCKPQHDRMTTAVKMKILRRRAKFEQKIADEFGLTLHFVEKFFRRHYEN